MTERQTTRRRAASSAWSYIAGEKGRNRVRVYEHAPYGLWIDYRDTQGKRVRQPLGYADRERAKLKAEEVAAQFRRTAEAPARATTLSALIDTYEREVSRRKSKTAEAHDTRTFPLFIEAFGARRRPSSLNRRDWDSYIERRRSGKLAVPGREGRPVRPRVVEQDCGLLQALLNWATRAGDGSGSYLLDRNPLSGLPIPREESPVRPVLSHQQYEAIRAAAATVSPRLETFVVVAWFTGHRSKSVRLLRWSDVDLDGARIHWRGENDKIDYDHWNPLHPEAVASLKAERGRAGAIGDAWIFPALRSKRPNQPLSEHAVANLWKRIAPQAGIPPRERYGWHSLRRAFANTLRDVSLRDLKDLGGWKSTRTVVQIYQQPSEDAQRRALKALDKPTTTDFPTERAQGTGTSDA